MAKAIKNGMFPTTYMADVTYSPDGKFMWTGTEWIPAPPNAASSGEQAPSLNMQDSVMLSLIHI